MLFIIRALPGAGKSTLARTLVGEEDTWSADDYFMEDGEYNFDPTKLAQAHAYCQDETRRSLRFSGKAAVANTFTQRWEIEPYLVMAREEGAQVTVIDLFDQGCTNVELTERNVHGVPCAAIQAMRERYEHDWRIGDIRPPWER